MSNTADVIYELASKRFSNGVPMPTAVEQALDEAGVDGIERRGVKSEVCSRLGKRGAKEKARLARIRNQPKFFRPMAPIVPAKPPALALDADEQYLRDERAAIQTEHLKSPFMRL